MQQKIAQSDATKLLYVPHIVCSIQYMFLHMVYILCVYIVLEYLSIYMYILDYISLYTV